MKALFVFAHPDDEAIICGGLMAKLAMEGNEVYLITATKGEASTAYDREYSTFEEIPDLREAELRKSCEILGVKELVLLGMLDGTLASVSDDEGVGAISKEITRIKPDIIVTFEPNGNSYHSDHRTIHKWVMKGLSEKLFCPEPSAIYWVTGRKRAGWIRSGIVMGHDDEDITDVIDIRPYAGHKRDAILAHRTQLRALEGHGLIVGGQLARNNVEECYIHVDSKGNIIRTHKNTL